MVGPKLSCDRSREDLHGIRSPWKQVSMNSRDELTVYRDVVSRSWKRWQSRVFGVDRVDTGRASCLWRNQMNQFATCTPCRAVCESFTKYPSRLGSGTINSINQHGNERALLYFVLLRSPVYTIDLKWLNRCPLVVLPDFYISPLQVSTDQKVLRIASAHVWYCIRRLYPFVSGIPMNAILVHLQDRLDRPSLILASSHVLSCWWLVGCFPANLAARSLPESTLQPGWNGMTCGRWDPTLQTFLKSATGVWNW